LQALEASFRKGKLVRDGIKAVLAGKPNVGKSSIFNRLVGFASAIVTGIPGTTRDALKEIIALGGMPVTLIDTAGIRNEQEETIEWIGVERSLQHLGSSDLVLFVVDCSAAFDDRDQRIWREIAGRPYLLLINKIDLPRAAELPERLISESLATVEICAIEGRNLEELREEIAKYARPVSNTDSERPALTRLRHRLCIEKARENLRKGLSVYLAGQGEEMALHDLRNCLTAVGELTGEVTTEEILDEVFSSFCIGK
jgi:tRNA modification GTPase